MRALLDTHALLWWLDGDRRLSALARRFIAEETNDVLVSAASAWEIATKVRLGPLPGAVEVAVNLPSILVEQRFEMLAISVTHGLRAGALPGPHRDPFDRMLIAQAHAEHLTLISNETVFDAYGIQRLW